MTNIAAIQKKLYPVFKYHDIKKAVLFGSFAKEKARENSDIDILVDSGLRGLSFYGLLEDVAESVDRPVDLIDISQLDAESPFMKEINETGVVIYG